MDKKRQKKPEEKEGSVQEPFLKFRSGRGKSKTFEKRVRRRKTKGNNVLANLSVECNRRDRKKLQEGWEKGRYWGVRKTDL